MAGRAWRASPLKPLWHTAQIVILRAAMKPSFSLFLPSLCCLMLAACSDNSAPPVAAKPVATVATAAVPAPALASAPVGDKLDEELMSAVFGAAYRVASGDALADQPDEEGGAKRRFVLSPIAHHALPDGVMVLVANGEIADDNGQASSAHASAGALNVFFLKRDAGQWRVVGRHENIAGLGSSGHVGEVRWVELAKGKPGMAILSGYSGMGSSISFLTLFELTVGRVRDLDGLIELASANDDGCGPTTDECWNVAGDWRFEPSRSNAEFDDVVVQFKGRSKKIAPGAIVDPDGEHEAPRVSTTLAGQVRYGYNGKQYKVIEGKNIVPGV